ncbi:FAD/NAD(P)-binding oxidoreductase [Actinosynnema sp. NPDC020468]|uniref:NAD(P)/FAD-dependent oxidoreductase n=1 Tax=Actinosynnema sp. NPDC020468 TaxID=3154488 RepID=UPI0033F7594A
MREFQVVIIGGGTAGVTVAARLRRAGVSDVAVVEPSSTHYYQPLWTLVGGGRASVEASARPTGAVLPRGVTWIRDSAVEVRALSRRVVLEREEISYRWLVVCPGIRLDWDRLIGLREAVGRDGVSSNYAYEYAPAMWKFIRDTRSGTAVFGMPSGPVKCAGAPQKIAYLAADHWRRTGASVEVHLVLPGPAIFGVPEYAAVLERVASRLGVRVHLGSEVVEVRPARRDVVVRTPSGVMTLPYDVAHLVPPQSAPGWVARSALAGESGFVDVDPGTLRHREFPEVFALGDVAGTPNAKTGAAVRRQAPVVVGNLLAARAGVEPPFGYGGYASCPITTGRGSLVLAEFDYSGRPTPSLGLPVGEVRDFGLVKRVGLPFLYWNLMLRGMV